MKVCPEKKIWYKFLFNLVYYSYIMSQIIILLLVLQLSPPCKASEVVTVGKAKVAKGAEGAKEERGVVAVEDKEEGAEEKGLEELENLEAPLEDLEPPEVCRLHQDHRLPCDHMINYIIGHATTSVQ